MTKAWGGINQWQYYAYDADGHRTRRKIDNQETFQIHFDGELLSEYAAGAAAANPQKEYGYRNGQLLITATPATGGGGSSNSLSLNGTSNYAEVPNSTSLNIVGNITVEAWIKVNSIGVYQDIITRESYGQAGTGGGYELCVTNLGKPRLDLYQGPTQYTTIIGATTMTTGTWHHVAGVFNGSQMRIYLNGVLDGTLSTTNGPASGTSKVRIGRTSVGSYFGGLIDEVRVSNSAIYTTTNFTPATTLTATGSTKGLWKFDGQTLNDSSGNGNNGTLVSGSYSTDVPGGVGGGAATQINWLVTDHLGTPRMILDQSGSLANLKRHDYLPFGEELGVGGRTTGQGYSGDNVRQKFTSKERDIETGLDYFGERYYASTMGRFTTVDPLGSSARRVDPQTMNRYTYALNNPLRYVDPDGLDSWDELTKREQDLIKQKLVLQKGQTSRDRFNQLVAGGDSKTTAANTQSVKLFVGAVAKTEAWQQISSIERVESNGANDKGEAYTSTIGLNANREGLLNALGNQGYDVNGAGDEARKAGQTAQGMSCRS